MRSKLMGILWMLLAVAMIAAACGDDDGGEGEGDAADATTTSSEVTETSADSATDGEDGDDGSTGGDICAAADAGPITIVHLTDISGEGETAIDDFWNGSSLAADTINEACGSEVVTLERIPTDFTAEGMEPTLLEAQEMEPTAIIGQGSSSQITLNNIVDEGGIPLLWPVGTANGLIDGENGSEWAWMVRPVNDVQGEIWGKHLASIGATNVWLECVETQFGISGCDAAERVLGEEGVEVAGRASSAFDASDFTQSIVDLLEAEADAVALVQFPGPQIAFAQQMEDNDALDVTTMGGASTEVIFGALSDAQRASTIAIADCNPSEDDPEVSGAYGSAYEDKLMTGLAAIAYDSVHLVVDAVAREGGTDPDSVKAGLESTGWSGVCQDYSDSGNRALAHRIIVTSFPDASTIQTEAEYPLNEDGTGLAE